LVSFTLTPMMSSRLVSVKDAGGHGHATSRRRFYRWIDGAYMRALGLAMRHRVIVSVIALLVIFSSVPLYRAVKQEFIPTNVDEDAFHVVLNRPVVNHCYV